MPHGILNIQGHDEQMHIYTGVLLATSLTKADTLMEKESEKRLPVRT